MGNRRDSIQKGLDDMRKATMRDVAQRAGVSVGTVSKYMNAPAHVNERNRAQIRVAIEELRYTPNALAKKLASGKSSTILLYMLFESEIGESTWLHHLPLVRAFNRVLDRTGFSLQVKIGSVSRPDASRAYLSTLIDEHSIDGVALFSSWETDPCLLDILAMRRFPFVLIDNHAATLSNRQIYFDNASMVDEMMGRLYALGHREIGFLRAGCAQQHMIDRVRGYRSFAEAHGIESERFMVTGEYTVESGYACMNALIDTGMLPTALIGGNDNMAAGACNAAIDRGLRIPEDLSLMGIDNSIVARATRPSLATVAPPTDKMGVAAIESLIALIEGRIDEIPNQVLPCTFVEGRSVGPPRKR